MTARVAILALLAGCLHPQLDRSLSYGGREPERSSADLLDKVPVLGHRVEVRFTDETELRGELLAVEPQAVYVLGDDGLVHPVAPATVTFVRVEVIPGNRAIAPWTAVGTASTLSHGFVLIFSAPTWLLVGAVSGAVAAETNDIEVPPEVFDQLYQYARFPGGLPPSWRAPAP